jgi:hypothetical protein
MDRPVSTHPDHSICGLILQLSQGNQERGWTMARTRLKTELSNES